MAKRDSAFTLLEILVVIMILGIITVFAIPQAYNAMKAYRVHSDASSLAAQLNVARFRATSQYAPYRIHIDLGTNTFFMERLCGSSSDSNCVASGTTAAAYQSLKVPLIEFGTQYLSSGDSFTTANPGGSATVKCPPPAPLSFTSCAGRTDFYFNTRGMPVNTTGAPVGNGGRAIYITGPTGLTDAVTVTVGGVVNTYNWGAGQWYIR